MPCSVIYFAIWHAAVRKQYGRVIYFLNKLQEIKATKVTEEQIIKVYELMGLSHVAKHLEKLYLSKFPESYKPF